MPVSHAFLYSNRQMPNLDDLIDPSLGVKLGVAWGINNRGQIVADHYLLTPISAVPEPSTLALFVVLGVAVWAHRRSSLFRNTTDKG